MPPTTSKHPTRAKIGQAEADTKPTLALPRGGQAVKTPERYDLGNVNRDERREPTRVMGRANAAGA